MSFVIALTGGIGSGKTSVAAILAELGAAVVDTDDISHELTAAGQPGARAIGAQFGAEYLDANGALDRKKMRELVFSEPAAKQRLESILHPMIRTEVAARSAKPGASSAPYTAIVVPLLLETGAYRELVRRILVVDCAAEQQIARVVRRSGLTPAAVKAIMASQVSREQRLLQADDIVRNDGDLPALRVAVEAVHRKYVDLAAKPAPH